MADLIKEEEVLAFVVEQIESIPHLEALLLLSGDPDRRWLLEEIAERIYVKPEAALMVVQNLRDRRLIAVEGPPQEYRFAPESERMRLMVERVAEVYRRQLVQITNLIHSKGSPSIRAFARAFRIKEGQ